jgi:hypothetical protein
MPMVVCHGVALTRLPQSYTRLNLEDDLKWQPNRMWACGLGYFFERYTYENGEVNAPKRRESLCQYEPELAYGRASVQYARRYNQWRLHENTDATCAMRQFFVQNRDQTKANAIFEVQLTKDITISPNGGMRWIEYPTDAVFNATPQLTNSLGTQYDRGWKPAPISASA